MARTKKPATPTPVEAVRHQDKRLNIPTDELRDFAPDAEGASESQTYPRDPSLDPQLVWKGKDEQDREPLSVPTVPIYIQETIVPQAIIENLRDTAPAGEAEPEMTLFEELQELDFEQVVDFYKWPVGWSNRLILGDSLLVMNSLAEKENLKGQVQMIYVDPPYGIKFGSNWQVSTRKRDVKDGKAEDVTRQPEQIRAYRDTWELGIHSYLSYLRDRLVLARDLLSESGSIFVQIGDENVHLVRNLMDEVFGSENFVSLIAFTKTTGMSSTLLPNTSDYLVWYARQRESVKFRPIYQPTTLGGAGATEYKRYEDADGSIHRMSKDEIANPALLTEGAKPLTTGDLTSDGGDAADITLPDGRVLKGKRGVHWKTTTAGIEKLWHANRLMPTGRFRIYKRYFEDFPFVELTNTWTDTRGEADKDYVVQTSTTPVQRCVLMTTDPGDLVLDPTCGSGTTAFVAEQWGRRWITVDTSRVALALARSRLMAAQYPYFLLADSEEGAAKEADITGVAVVSGGFHDDVRKGFVYTRVPHITLKSIAQNPDVTPGMTRDEIDAAIRRHADTALLVDQPFEGDRVRVSGAFTVESLSPHRVLDEVAESPASEQTETTASSFVEMILDNLRKAGVQNTKRDERLTFDSLVPFPGEWINGEGEFTDADGGIKRVAVSIGPEHGTVGPMQVKEAAKEAVKGRGFDILVICGFSFDARVGEVAKEFGKLAVLPARMNPDLAMGDELLKKTGAGNLFMVFGEPDLTVKHENDQVVVELRGVDVYDPTTGEVRSSSTDDIACWSIDTNYNGENFFVRHAYFTGADKPYEKLSKTLRADIDEAAWASLYSTVSRPFDPPETGKIAVKVINHYGDEVMHVYDA